jgi:hypothetical protein
MTLQELDEKLRSISPAELKKFNDEYGGGQKTVEERVREYVDCPIHERRLCQLLGLKTESEKITEATVNSADAAKKSASSAKLSIIISLILTIITFASLYFQYFYRHDDVKLAILWVWANTSPSKIYNGAFTADVVFVNNGNQACSVTQVFLETEDLDDKVFDSIRPLNLTPFTLKPKDVVTMRLALKSGADKFVTRFLTRKKNRIATHLVFGVIDSKGDYHTTKVLVLEGRLKGSQGELEPTLKFPDFGKGNVVQLLPSPVDKVPIQFR